MNANMIRPVMLADASVRRGVRLVRPRTAAHLHRWVGHVLGFDVPRVPLIAGHDAPFDYLCHAFFEDARPPDLRNALVWAARGSGKTQLGAIATLLDLLFKPGIDICILGGSFAQSSRMHEHLRRLLNDDAFIDLVEGDLTQRHVILRNGSRVEVLGQSQTAVRGRRVHRLRCDEVDLFEPEVWEAAQMITRSGRCGEIDVQAGVEALSTMHRPFGLMSALASRAVQVRAPGQIQAPAQVQAPPGSDIDVVGASRRVLYQTCFAGRPQHAAHAAHAAPLPASSTRLFRWSAMDVLEHCPPARRCDSCDFFADGCGGAAKRLECRGFLRIDDALDQRLRVSPRAWQAEMLCERPDVSDCVYPEFDESIHVFGDGRSREIGDVDRHVAPASVTTWLGGLDFGFRSPSVLLLAALDGCNVLRVMDEIVQRSCITQRMIERAKSRCNAWRARPMWIGADPAGLARNDQSGVSNIALWRRSGFAVRARFATIESGIELVRMRLAGPAGGGGGSGSSPGLLVHRRCANLIRALREYHFDPDDPHRETPVKDGPDHAADALRYLVANLDGRGGRASGGEY